MYQNCHLNIKQLTHFASKWIIHENIHYTSYGNPKILNILYETIGMVSITFALTPGGGGGGGGGVVYSLYSRMFKYVIYSHPEKQITATFSTRYATMDVEILTERHIETEYGQV